MHHLIRFSILASVLVMPSISMAIPVRTLAFDLPANEVNFDLAPLDKTGDGKSDSKNKLHLDARMNQFSVAVNLPPGRYQPTSKSFKSTDPFTLPDGEGARYLLLILPKGDGTCLIFPIPDAVTKIGPGTRFLLNATREEIAVRFGSQKSTLKPGQSEYLHPPHPTPADQRIEVEMARRDGNSWVPFNSTYWPLDPRARSFVLLYPDPVTGSPRTKNLSEVPK